MARNGRRIEVATLVHWVIIYANFMRTMFREVLGFTLINLLALSLQAQPKPLTNVHAHNDYVHTHPLFDALDHGFCSVEADIHLVEDQLLVAHTRSQVKPGSCFYRRMQKSAIRSTIISS